ncbi:hypothetical protein KSC_096650 [Ktedonobacter sp. SOSP1-52]|uniref:ABC transporter ATP-binding protein n=1 Tax=Ktedonobacter sp. SOSP1-52 TaxID=2778366 RepID=UPI0019169F10|nr:ABC transporter ATP-binding protein [Ktedonobacter sp. SOSP1-52]GHO70773.1 hypothetical protein KSC_096650 [Ktedonobacter sp. SOSP1-52]
MRLSLPTFKPRQTRSAPNKKNHEQQEEPFQISHIFKSLAQFPQAMGRVWQASKRLTLGMLILSTIRGFLPACSALIAKMVVDSVVHGIQTHSISPLWLPIVLQLIVSLFDRLLSRSSLVVQQLLQDRTSNHIQLLIFEKANTLDLAFFEQPEFYDKLRTASSESSYKPVLMVALVFETLRTTITLISMLFLLIQLAWWLTTIALVVPIPSFLASAKYGWYDYRRMIRQSPEKRKMNYYNQILTVDLFNKELKLFSLGEFFVERYRQLAAGPARSSRNCPQAMRPRSANGLKKAYSSAAVNGKKWPWPGSLYARPGYSSSTSQPAPSMPRPSTISSSASAS